MKKIFTLLAMLIAFSAPAMAKTIKVEALSDFTTENPPKYMQVKAVTDLQLSSEIVIMPDYILKGQIVDVKDPTRLKRNATFSFVLLSYIDNSGKEHEIKDYFIGKYTTKFDTASMAKSAALSVGNHFVKGISLGYHAVEGAVKNEEGNRFKSSAVSVYESTPFSYVENGEEIVIPKNNIFILNFKVKGEENEEDKPNYEFTPLENPAVNSTEPTAVPLPENPSDEF